MTPRDPDKLRHSLWEQIPDRGGLSPEDRDELYRDYFSTYGELLKVGAEILIAYGEKDPDLEERHISECLDNMEGYLTQLSRVFEPQRKRDG